MTLEFRPLSLNRQSKYIELLRASGTNASDYSFANIWGWAEEYDLRWAWEEDLVWIQQNRPAVCLARSLRRRARSRSAGEAPAA